MGSGVVKSATAVPVDAFERSPFPEYPNLLSAMERADGMDSKAVLDACAVVEKHVRFEEAFGTQRQFGEDGSTGLSALPDARDLRQCQSQLVTLLKQAQERAAVSVKGPQRQFGDEETPHMECETSSEETKAIANATIALFKLENHGFECKDEFKKAGGIDISLKAMDKGLSEHINSGISHEAMESLAQLLLLLLDGHPDNIESIIASGGHFTLVPYVADPTKHNIPKDMHGHCRAVLEACLQYDPHIINKLDIRRAYEGSRITHFEERPQRALYNSEKIPHRFCDGQ